jgi:hypothetical protein
MATKAKRTGKRGGPGAGPALLWLLTRVVLPLAVLYALLWWRADAAVEKQLSNLRPYVDIQRGFTVLGLNGDVGFRNLQLTPHAGGALPPVTVRAERVVLHTPGLVWLVRSSLFGVPREIPSRVGFSLSRMGLDGSPQALQAAMAGGNVLFPFDLAGCEAAMTPAVAIGLGLERMASDVSVVAHNDGSGTLRMRIESASPLLVRYSGDVRLTLAPGADPAMQLGGASFQSLDMVINDEGFVNRRNVYCAGKLGIGVDEFVPVHLAATRAAFAADGLVPGAAMTEAYAGFSKDGGALTVQVKPRRAMPFLQMQGMTAATMGLYFDATVRHDDGFAAPLVFLPADQQAGDAPAPAEAPLPELPGEPAAAPAADVVRVSPGQEIAYDDLPAYLGSRVEIETSLGSVRRGELTGASSLSVVVKLAPEDGGFVMSLPKYNVVRVRLASSPTETPDR